MKTKFIIVASVVLILALGFLYVSHGYVPVNDKNGKTECTNMSGCTQHKQNTVRAGGEWSSYEFMTDKACCDEMQSTLKSQLMGVAGVKDVKFSPTCSVSKMTNVSVYYSASETTEETLASFVKDKGFDCSGSCDPKNCPMKNKKTSEGKNI